MSATQIGVVVVAGAFLAATVSSFLPEYRPTPIVINSITVNDGMVEIDRFIPEGDNASVAMDRTAELIDAATGESWPQCRGFDHIIYPTGHVIRTVTLERFIGNPACTMASLDPARRYTPHAIWAHGDVEVEAFGTTFSPGEK